MSEPYDNPYTAEAGEGEDGALAEKRSIATSVFLWMTATVFLGFGACCGLFGFTAALNRWNDAVGRFIWDQGDGLFFSVVATITAALFGVGLFVLYWARK